MKGKKFIQSIWAVMLLAAAMFTSFLAGGQTAEAAQEAVPAEHFCLIGDSRFVGMQSAVGAMDDVDWIDRVGAGNGFFFENAEQIDALDRDTIIVYNLGVNDLDASGGVKALNALKSMGFEHIWFATVPPVDEARATEYGYTITNNQITWYNYIVTSSLPSGVGVIDSYNYLAGRGIESDDGLHYRDSTYLDWFAYIVNNAY